MTTSDVIKELEGNIALLVAGIPPDDKDKYALGQGILADLKSIGLRNVSERMNQRGRKIARLEAQLTRERQAKNRNASRARQLESVLLALGQRVKITVEEAS